MNTHRITLCLLCLAMTVSLPACQKRLKGGTERYEDAVAELMKAERDAAARSAHEGFTRSMIASLDDSAVLLRPHMMPAKGAAARSTLQGHPDTGYSLVWEPLEGVVAESGELGYTYGTYTWTEKTTGKREQGTYATIWRKDKDDQWKMVLDVGNPGLQPQVPDTAGHQEAVTTPAP